MRRLALAMMCSSVLLACGGVQPGPSAPLGTRGLEAEFDQAWEATVRTLGERGYDIQRMDRVAGIIETGWQTINPDYLATAFVTQQEDRYSTCGKPRLGQAFRGKEARMDFLLHPIRPRETTVRIAAFFRTRRYSDVPLRAARPLGDVVCSSKGRLEDEVRVQVQFRAISAQLERLRRGIP